MTPLEHQLHPLRGARPLGDGLVQYFPNRWFAPVHPARIAESRHPLRLETWLPT